jgi:hypothetical protein
VVTGPDGRVRRYRVKDPAGGLRFAMRVGPEFHEDCLKVIEGLPAGAWSKAAVVRMVMAQAAGRTLVEVVEEVEETPVFAKPWARKQVELEVPTASMISKLVRSD